jgi:hypothetical protein
MQEQITTTQTPAVPRSIVRKAKHSSNTNNGKTRQWTATQVAQQQTVPTNLAEEI